MGEKKYKRIGRIVETRATRDLPWIHYTYAMGLYKKNAIHKFEFVNEHLKYKRLERDGLARCAEVFIKEAT